MNPGTAVDVYRARAGVVAVTESAVALLDGAERARLDRLLRPQDRARYTTGHLLLRLVVQAHTGVPAREQRFSRTCLLCGGPHGKPRLAGDGAPDVHVNLSYAGPYVVAAVSAHAPLGVDVEQWEATDFAGFSTAALTRAEAQELLGFDVVDRPWARAVWWARKEAALKATGHGLRVDATDVRVTPPDRPARLLSWTDAEVPAPTLRLADVPTGPGYACAVAVLARPGDDLEAGLDVRTHDADDLVASFPA
ncbi:4'-phosphopantetheinyl transferase family protein [Agilicoccus flavus]|uniref:4'-phosphopantetheinyl transferase family protein n=1 Tax=Agilicoccus flavus TaxID=2775968 RepID=UPI001CF648F5|nr:4'-phosphopantetheinyl transferase superfamily protein [Agilicoccus flavus]